MVLRVNLRDYTLSLLFTEKCEALRDINYASFHRKIAQFLVSCILLFSKKYHILCYSEKKRNV